VPSLRRLAFSRSWTASGLSSTAVSSCAHSLPLFAIECAAAIAVDAHLCNAASLCACLSWYWIHAMQHLHHIVLGNLHHDVDVHRHSTVNVAAHTTDGVKG
jgi:hypothetical protein